MSSKQDTATAKCTTPLMLEYHLEGYTRAPLLNPSQTFTRSRKPSHVDGIPSCVLCEQTDTPPGQLNLHYTTDGSPSLGPRLMHTACVEFQGTEQGRRTNAGTSGGHTDPAHLLVATSLLSGDPRGWSRSGEGNASFTCTEVCQK
jgi:hypothetical protein